MLIEIPTRLNGNSFYDTILPQVQEQLEKGDCKLDFDLQKVEIANPEGFVNLFALALMIKNKNKGNYIPKLYMPESENLIRFMEYINFFETANVPNCNVFSTTYRPLYEKKHTKSMLRIFGVFVHSADYSSYNIHYSNIERIVQNIRIQLNDDIDENNSFYKKLQDSLLQLIRNTLEHNSDKKYGALGYYMAQVTPYGTIEFVFSDAGKGYRNRIIEMINENNDSNIQKYRDIRDIVSDDSFLYTEDVNNPNRISIEAAVNYRNDSRVPGLFQIRNFVLNQEESTYRTQDGRDILLKPELFIHSDNYSIKYIKENNKEKTISQHHKNSFDGCHIKMVVPIPTNICKYE